MKIANRETSQDLENTTMDSYEVVEKEADRIVLRKTVESVKVKTTGSGADAAESTAKKMQGAVFTIHIDLRKNEVVKVEGVEDFVKKIFEDNSLMRQALSATLNADSVRDEVQNVLVAFLPDGAVEKGKSWTRESRVALGPVGAFETKGEYTYQGKSTLDGKEVDKIECTWTFSHKLPAENGNTPFEISKGSFKPEKSSGTYYFDVAAGRLIQMERKYAVRGTITIKTTNGNLDMAMSQDVAATVRLRDKSAPTK
jgi:hypothetical protein